MKITDVTLRKAKHYLFVQIHTDESIVGLGEAGNWAYLNATAAAIEKLVGYLIGKDPFRIEDFNQNFMRAQYFRGSVIMSAISAIDIALWDIKGKKLGVPVYELLGGRVRDKVRVYASPMSKETDPESLVNSYRQLKEMGFTAAKIFRRRSICLGAGAELRRLSCWGKCSSSRAPMQYCAPRAALWPALSPLERPV